MSVDQLPDPPGPPPVRRRIRLYPYQWIGLSLLAVIPVLALAGLFGEKTRTDSAEGPGIEVVIQYPNRVRYKQLHRIEVWARNRSVVAFDTLRVALDSALANRFSEVRATPDFEKPYELSLTGVGAGETALALIELKADRYGRHSGELSVWIVPAAATDGGRHGTPAEPVRVPLSIRVFP